LQLAITKSVKGLLESRVTLQVTLWFSKASFDMDYLALHSTVVASD